MLPRSLGLLLISIRKYQLALKAADDLLIGVSYRKAILTGQFHGSLLCWFSSHWVKGKMKQAAPSSDTKETEMPPLCGQKGHLYV